MWIAFAAASAFFAGITSILAKCGIKKTDSNITVAIRTVVVLIFSWFIVWMSDSYTMISQVHTKTIVFLVLSGISTGASWLCYFKALQIGNINKVVPIDKSSTVLTILLAFLFLGEEVGIYKGIGILGIAAGTFMMLEKKDIGEKKEGKGWFLYAVLSAVFASMTAILGKIGIHNIDSNLGTAIRTIVVLIMAWIMVVINGKMSEVRKIEKTELIYILISGIATGLSWLCYYKALQDGEASVVVPIDKLSILVTIVFSYFIFKEKLTKRALAGLLFIVSGTLIMLL